MEEIFAMDASTMPIELIQQPDLMSLFPVLGVVFFVAALVTIGVYVFMGLALMNIGKKAGLKENVAGLAWTPAIGFVILSFVISGTPWWLWIIISAGFVLSFLALLSPILGGILYVLWGLALIGIVLMWLWKMYEAVKKPGWWAIVAPAGMILGSIILFFAPVIGGIINVLAGLSFFVLLGLAAWTK